MRTAARQVLDCTRPGVADWMTPRVESVPLSDRESEILKLLVAGMLRRAFRHQDKVFRFGGEEFVALLQGLDAAGAGAALQRLRQTIESHRFPQVGQVTVSLGVASRVPSQAWTEPQPAPEGTKPLASAGTESLVGAADAALYRAKHAGRNRAAYASS